MWMQRNSPFRWMHSKDIHLRIHLCLWILYFRVALKRLYTNFELFWIFKKHGLLGSLFCFIFFFFVGLSVNKVYKLLLVCWHSTFRLACLISFCTYLVCVLRERYIPGESCILKIPSNVRIFPIPNMYMDSRKPLHIFSLVKDIILWMTT